MKNIFGMISLLFGCFLMACQPQDKAGTIVAAYVTSQGESLPDPSVLTHINYAFGHVDSTFDKVRIDREERLREIVALKKNYPELKVSLSIGGWGSGNFSEMAADEQKRLSFAKDCGRIVKDFNLDGIDIDWEYPTSDAAGISCSPDDTGNYTLLMRDIREAIGKDKLLTLASSYRARFIDFRAIAPYIDFVNIMAYDMGKPPYHNAALYPSEMTRKGASCEESLEAHIAAGVPVEKIVLGIPFYGHGADSILPYYVDYKNIDTLRNYTVCWDSTAQVPYATDSTGMMVCTYEDPRSIALKCDFIHEKKLLGVMYWEYNTDNSEGDLRRATFNGMMKK